jgi:NAD(P)-dependent dehydrogenase (short-subunit alcohol dehydrogenase family)
VKNTTINTTMAPLVWFITGGNSGFGLLLAQHALAKGDTVIATARSVAKFPKALQTSSAVLKQIEMTASEVEISGIIDDIVEKHGRIDVLVNNAGFGHVGAVEEISSQEARYQFDVNFFGLYNFTRAAIPHMRKQGSGVIVQLSSGAGLLGGPGGAVYCASKFAVEGLTESMASELQPFGIRVHLVEPGIFRTNFLKPAAEGRNMGQKKEGYVDIGSAMGAIHGSQPGNPQLGVERIYELVTGTGMAAGLQDQLRMPMGSDCYGMLKKKVAMLSETLEKFEKIAASTDY